MSSSGCIAYREGGALCRMPATILDHQRGGMVCLAHVPADVAEEITLYIKMGATEGRIDNEGEVYTSNRVRTLFASVGNEADRVESM